MSVLDDFVRMRLYRTRASEFELLAETEPLSEARLRYRIIARHYRELADREEQSPRRRQANTGPCGLGGGGVGDGMPLGFETNNGHRPFRSFCV
jgi:hypothetical protein